MIEFTKLIVEGFCSIGELDLPLNIPGITVIRAANGFGKSTIFSALVWALYGKNIKGNYDVNTWENIEPKLIRVLRWRFTSMLMVRYTE